MSLRKYCGGTMNYYNEIKELIINNEVTKKVKEQSRNKSDLTTNYNIGKLLVDAGKHYGEGIVKEYSKRLMIDIGKKYSVRVLYKMIKYYNYVSTKKVPTVSANLSWSHYDELLGFDDIAKINYYIVICYQQNLTIRQLRERIKGNEYERLPNETKLKLINKEEPKVQDLVKNPILIKNNSNYEVISEKVLQKLILEDIESFMKELGNSFCFIASEYKIKLGNTYNYIDILLFNIEFNCYVVVELKVTELKKEHVGQIEVYMNYIDENLKKISHDKTIGLIVCKKNNGYIIRYSTDKRISAKEYELI